jgi:hypothetical protein
MECPGPPVNCWAAAGDHRPAQKRDRQPEIHRMNLPPAAIEGTPDRGVPHVGEAVSGGFETMDRPRYRSLSRFLWHAF